jgi:hypothetical protein
MEWVILGVLVVYFFWDKVSLQRQVDLERTDIADRAKQDNDFVQSALKNVYLQPHQIINYDNRQVSSESEGSSFSSSETYGNTNEVFRSSDEIYDKLSVPAVK